MTPLEVDSKLNVKSTGRRQHTPLILALRRQRQRQADQPGLQNEFPESQGYAEKPSEK